MYKFAKMPSNLKTMPDDESNPKKPELSPDKLIRGVLSKLGEKLDGVLGGQTGASGRLPSGELVSRTKKVIDSLILDKGENGKFAPHIFLLKIQWNKFSQSFKKDLETELLLAVIDHINDNRYHTFAPVRVSAEKHYVTDIQVTVGFGEFDPKDRGFIVLLPEIEPDDTPPEPREPEPELVLAKFSLDGVPKEITLRFIAGQRVRVGRTRENDLEIKNDSVSKDHAALYFSPTGEFSVSDVGSSNGTFINKERLAYGKAFPVGDGDMVEFGSVAVLFEHIIPEPETAAEIEAPETTEEEPEGIIRIELNDGSESEV